MVSKHKVNPRIEERMKELFYGSLADLKKKSEVQEFLDEFLTPTEHVMFSKRLAIAVLIIKEYDVRTISKILKVSSSTVMRINFWMVHSGRSFRRLAEKIVSHEKSEEDSHNFWHAIESSTVTWQHGDWGARRRQINQEHREFQEKHIV